MAKWKPLKGMKFGKLTVLEDFRDETKKHKHYCKCQCSCENKTIVNVAGDRLVGGKVTHCGCEAEIVRKPLKGKVFGKLTVLEDFYDDTKPIGHRHYCKCQCNCEDKTILNIRSDGLTSGERTNCGCEGITVWKALKGKQFGLWTVLEDVKTNKHMCKCKCSCGTIKIVSASNLISGRSKKCGKKHTDLYIGGLTCTRFGRIWVGIISRCTKASNKAYPRYGGRGIKCLWKNIDDFYNDMYESYQQHVEQYGEKDTTIERIDNDGNYCKENCKWATRQEQQLNKSNTYTILDKDGELLSTQGYCKKHNISYSLVRHIGERAGVNVRQALDLYFKDLEGVS